MIDTPNNSDAEWDYLSGVLNNSNKDDDLAGTDDRNQQISKKPKTQLESQIQNLISPNVLLTSISEIRPGKIHIHGRFNQVSGRYIRRDMHITDAVFTDSTGSVRVVWFNQPYKATSIKHGVEYELRGNFNLYRGRFQVSNAKIRPLLEGCKPFERGVKG